MSKLFAAFGLGVLAIMSAPHAMAVPDNQTAAVSSNAAESAVPAGEQLEKELQGLDWKQFKAVISAIPKLKADVDAYGPLGWQYVQANYKTYRWRKNIDKLDNVQKIQLAQLIRKTKGGAQD